MGIEFLTFNLAIYAISLLFSFIGIFLLGKVLFGLKFNAKLLSLFLGLWLVLVFYHMQSNSGIKFTLKDESGFSKSTGDFKIKNSAPNRKSDEDRGIENKQLYEENVVD